MYHASDYGYTIEGQLPGPSRATEGGYVIVWRSGGTLKCKWTRALTRYLHRADADEAAQRVTRAGYKTVIHPWNQIVACGLPIGWESASVDWESDLITITRDPAGVMLSTDWTQSGLRRGCGKVEFTTAR